MKCQNWECSRLLIRMFVMLFVKLYDKTVFNNQFYLLISTKNVFRFIRIDIHHNCIFNIKMLLFASTETEIEPQLYLNNACFFNVLVKQTKHLHWILKYSGRFVAHSNNCNRQLVGRSKYYSTTNFQIYIQRSNSTEKSFQHSAKIEQLCHLFRFISSRKFLCETFYVLTSSNGPAKLSHSCFQHIDFYNWILTIKN